MIPANCEDSTGDCWRLAGLAVLWLLLAVILFPFAEMISTSLNARQEDPGKVYPPVWPPTYRWRNYIDVWSIKVAATYVKNSLITAAADPAQRVGGDPGRLRAGTLPVPRPRCSCISWWRRRCSRRLRCCSRPSG